MKKISSKFYLLYFQLYKCICEFCPQYIIFLGPSLPSLTVNDLESEETMEKNKGEWLTEFEAV